MSTPDIHQPAEAEHDVLAAARARQQRCTCGEVHDDDTGITPAVIARMQAYLAANPGHQFAVDEEAGIVAVIVPRDDPEPPEILARSEDLIDLLDTIDAPPASALS